ncbi:MAG: enoyl-CoA hydratase-related protein [Sphingobacteriales bacterium]|jgi:2-(1,2-epoxy-1,2-dihydrophenyl)acetyl-CoA isomerase|nr:enoyl-CoA hydratase-related protein [Sphingobacteriales bacterium]
MPFISASTEGAVRVLKLDRPEKFNSFNREMALTLQAELDLAAADENIRAVLITASGKAFCAGQDLSEAIAPDGPGIRKIVAEHYNPIIRKLRAIEKPVVCAVNGVAAGAGASLALACDIVVASKSAAFIQAFSKIGLIPDSGATFLLPRLVGFHRAAALMMTAEKVTADEALHLGLVFKVFHDEEFATEAMRFTEGLAAMPTRGLGLTKRLLNAGLDNSLDEQLDLEEQIQAEAASTEDHKEGVEAFLQKRQPQFNGR